MEYTNTVINSKTPCAPIVDDEAGHSMDSGKITISFYENEIPPFVEAEMERLYENVYTSLARFKIYGELENTSTYVVRKGDKAITVFLFRREQEEVKVLNKQIKIDEEDIYRFSNTIFSTFKSVNIISFCAIQTAVLRRPFFHQRCYFLEDIVLTLPKTAEEYFASLGKRMRRNVRYYMKRVERDFPSFHYQIYEKEDVSAQHIRDIIKLSGARMAAKNKTAYVNEEEAERIIHLARVYGFAGVATIDDRVCAGLICYRIGAHYFMHVVAHDPGYDGYRLGTLCYYRTICECIARGGKECRLMGSSHQYKFDLLGVRTGFDYLAVYRSRAHFLLNSARVIKIAFRASALRTRLWLLHAERRTGFVSRIAAWCVNTLRNLKRYRYGFLLGRK